MNTDTTPARAAHLSACKARALADLDAGRPGAAMASMIRGLEEHPETACHPGGLGGVVRAMAGLMSTEAEMRDWIEGFE